MKIIFSYLGGFLAVGLVTLGKKYGYVDNSTNWVFLLSPAISTALADDYAWLADWLDKIKEKTINNKS